MRNSDYLFIMGDARKTNFGWLGLGRKEGNIGVAWRGYRTYLQKLKVPVEVSSKPGEKEREEKWLKIDASKIDIREKSCGKKEKIWRS